MCLKFKLPGHVACVEARVVQSDIEHSDGHVLQVFAPVPLQTTLEGALHLLVAIAILVYLQREGWKQMVVKDRVEGRTEFPRAGKLRDKVTRRPRAWGGGGIKGHRGSRGRE